VKGISPVISVLLMIAIAVAASLVAYAWVMGYMDSTTAKVGETIQIQSVSNPTGIVSDMVYVQNIGDSAVTIMDLYVDGALNNGALSQPLDPEATVGIPVVGGFAADSALKVTVKVVTANGISAEYTKTFP
jgi:flagellin-like protein